MSKDVGKLPKLLGPDGEWRITWPLDIHVKSNEVAIRGFTSALHGAVANLLFEMSESGVIEFMEDQEPIAELKLWEEVDRSPTAVEEAAPSTS